jgi:hypothetical protein
LTAQAKVPDAVWDCYRAGVGAPLYFLSSIYDHAYMQSLLDAIVEDDSYLDIKHVAFFEQSKD